MAQPQQNVLRGVLLCLIMCVSSAATGVIAKHLGDTVPIPMVVLCQYMVGFVSILPWLRRQSLNSLKTAHWFHHLIRALTGWLCFYAFFASLEYLPLVEAVLFRGTSPLFLPLIVWLWLQITIPALRWVPLIVGFIGIYLILRPEGGSIGLGYILGLGSGIAYAISMVATRILSRTEDTKLILFYYFFFSLVCSVPPAIIEWQPIPLWTLPFLLFIGISITSSLWLYTLALSYTSATVVGPMTYLSVVTAGLMGWAIWGHIPDAIAFAGISLVIASGVLAAYIGYRDEKKQAQESLTPITPS